MSSTKSRGVPLAGLGLEIRGIRESLAETQQQFAQRLDVAISSIQKWEAGRNRPHRRMLAKIRGLAPLPGSAEKKSRRYKEETITEAHAALDLVLDRARSDVVEKVLAELTKFGGRFADKKD